MSILLLGTLSTFFAEVFSGASHLWFIDPWGLLVTLPLYLSHTLFLLNLAVKTGRTSLRQLYYWGMLFGLYESWITKVLWAGYFDAEGPMFGTFLGVAWAEFLTLVLFWHPLMSFIIPILTYEVLSGDFLPNHRRYLRKSRRKTLLIFLILLIGASLQSTNSKYDLATALGSMAGSIAIICLINRIAKEKKLKSLELSNKGLILLAAYLTMLYASTFFLLLPERIPRGIVPWTPILFWYALTLLLLKYSKPSFEKADAEGEVYGKGDFSKYMVTLLILTAVMCIFPPVSQLIAITFVLSIIALSPIILIGTLLK